MTDYDYGFFKLLAKNDLSLGNSGTGGKQGGPYIPKALHSFLPPLPDSGLGPTGESFLTLDLFDDASPVGRVAARWHYQTWGQTRAREARLTRGIVSGLLRNAAPDDMLVFERELRSHDRFRVTLLRPDSERYRDIMAVATERWGSCEPGREPADLSVIVDEATRIRERSEDPLKLFSADRPVDAFSRVVRGAAFRRLVLEAYDTSCAACGQGWIRPIDEPEHRPPAEPEAAHIVPVALGGPDDLRNALALCRSHHWAFDQYVLYLADDLTWRVANPSKRENRNGTLNDIDGARFRPPRNGFPGPDRGALEWHRSMVAAS